MRLPPLRPIRSLEEVTLALTNVTGLLERDEQKVSPNQFGGAVHQMDT